MIKIRWGMWIKVVNMGILYNIYEMIYYFEVFNDNRNERVKRFVVIWILLFEFVLKWNIDGLLKGKLGKVGIGGIL